MKKSEVCDESKMESKFESLQRKNLHKMKTISPFNYTVRYKVSNSFRSV